MMLFFGGVELELELILSQMAQKPMLRGEVSLAASADAAPLHAF